MATEFERKLESLDLSPIFFKITHLEEGLGWGMSKAKAVEVWYRRYHALINLFPDRPIVPTREIDEYWHFHILDTRKYLEDCMWLHGKIVHHFPYFGLRGEKDKADLDDAFRNTLTLFKLTFGSTPTDIAEGNAICSSSCSWGIDAVVPPMRSAGPLVL